MNSLVNVSLVLTMNGAVSVSADGMKETRD